MLDIMVYDFSEIGIVMLELIGLYFSLWIGRHRDELLL